MARADGRVRRGGAPLPSCWSRWARRRSGDFFLAFDKKWLLPLGILSFLIAQLAYLLIFFALWFFSGDNSPLWPRYVAMALIIATAIGFLIWMAPKLGWMALGVVPYAIAITGDGVHGDVAAVGRAGRRCWASCRFW